MLVIDRKDYENARKLAVNEQIPCLRILFLERWIGLPFFFQMNKMMAYFTRFLFVAAVVMTLIGSVHSEEHQENLSLTSVTKSSTISDTNLIKRIPTHINDDGNNTKLGINNTSSARPYWSEVTPLPGVSLVNAFATLAEFLFVGSDNGVFLTTFAEIGGGQVQSWTGKNSGLTDKNVRSLCFSSDGMTLFAGTSSGVFLSSNKGDSWTAMNAGLTNTYVNALVVSGSNLFAATLDGVFVCTLPGANWTAVSRGLSNKNVFVLTSNGSDLYAGTDDGIFQSTNNGAYWSATNNGLTNTDVNCLVVNGSNIFLGTFSNSAFFSTNNAAGWNQVHSSLTSAFVNALGISGTVLFTGTNNGMFLTANANVSSVNTGTPFFNVSMGLPPGTNIRSISIAGQNIVIGTHGGKVWKRALYEMILPPDPPSGSTPADGTTDVPTNPTIGWSTSFGEVVYRLQVSLDPNFSNLIVDVSDLGSTNYNLGSLINNTSYYWRVSAANGVGYGSWSSVMSFTTIALPEIRINKLSIAFGNVLKNTAVRDTFKITNGTRSYLVIDSIYSRSSTINYRTGIAVLSNSDTTKLVVTFTPQTFGTFNDTISIRNNSPVDLVKVYISGNSPYPTISTNKTTIAYGMTALNRTKQDTISILNSSFNSLEVDTIYSGKKVFSVDRQQATVGKDTLKVVVSFTPTEMIRYSDTVYFKNNSLLPMVKVAVGGESPLPTFTISPQVFNKEILAIDDSSFQSFIVRNTSINDLPYDTIGITRTSFQIRGGFGGKVNANDSSVFLIQFKPTAFGDVIDTAIFTSLGRIIKLPLSGSSPYPAMTLSRSSFNFDNVKYDNSRKISLVVKNISINRLRIDSLKTRMRQFRVEKFIAPVFVSKNDSASFFVTFTPDTIKSYSDTLKIFTNQQIPIVFAMLTGNGSLTSAPHVDGEIPTIYELQQNYPNPFNPSTTLSYSLPVNSRVTLDIYNILGQRVAELISADQAGGYYRVTWNANVASGLYFYRIIAVSKSDPNRRFVDIKKMIVLR
jgi:ligand-binding sensor domain-containing protein